MISSPSSSASRSARRWSLAGRSCRAWPTAARCGTGRSASTWSSPGAGDQAARLERVAVVGVADHARRRTRRGECEHAAEGVAERSRSVASTRSWPSVAAKVTSPAPSSIASNRKARRNYAILDTIEAGLVLQGSEVKACAGHVQLADAYARIQQRRGRGWRACTSRRTSSPTASARTTPTGRASCCCTATRSSASKAQVDTERLSLVPLSLLLQGRPGQGRAGVGKGRRKADKRQAMAERDTQRDMATCHGPAGERPNRLSFASSSRV